MLKALKWLFEFDDDNSTEFWRNAETGELVEVQREGPPLYTIPADQIADQPLYGPPTETANDG